jgi:multicomponent Na+:H+ antiporter subunit C
MEVMLAVLTGVLVTAGAYLMMSGKTLPYLFGLTMISNAANILIFVAGRLTFGEPPLVPKGDAAITGAANALPYRTYYVLETTEMDEMRQAEPVAEGGD